MDANPFENLCWLLNDVKNRGKPLEEGMVIITGSISQIRPALSGDKILHMLDSGIKVEVEIK